MKDPLKKEARRYLIGVLILFAICCVLVAIGFLTHKKGESERRLPAPVKVQVTMSRPSLNCL